MTQCVTCQEEFTQNRPWQKYCSKKCKSNGWYFENTDKARASKAKAAGILSRVKSRAKKNEIPFDLTIEDIVIPTECPILGIPLEFNQGRQGYFANSPSVDRIDPKKGYTKGNVRVISARANLLKNDATSAELTLILEDLRALGF